MHKGMFTTTDKGMAIVGNVGTWTLASVAWAQDFMWLAAGVCSITTAVYFITKTVVAIKHRKNTDNE